MTEPTLFRKVLCKDRLPDENGRFQTDFGLRFYNDVNECFCDEKRGWRLDVTYWLEPVQEPTEEEIRTLARNVYSLSKQINEGIAYVLGFKKALELLKGKS